MLDSLKTIHYHRAVTDQPHQSIQDSLKDSDTLQAGRRNVLSRKFLQFLLLVLLVVTIPFTVYLLQKRESYDIRSRAQIGSPLVPQDLTPLLSGFDNRVDLDNNGSWDSYYRTSLNSTDQTCSLSLYRLSDKSLRWSSSQIPNCISFQQPIFHWRSFMGSSDRDFTLVILGPASDRDFHLKVGDGATGRLRDFDLFMGDSQRVGITRIRAVATIDLRLSAFPGPALAIRTNGATTHYPPDPGSHFHGRLFYFPGTSNGFVELTTDSTVIKPGTTWTKYPFPGADLPTNIGNFDALYNRFNTVNCQPNYGDCRVEENGSGEGGFMGKLMVGDIDADGFEDLHMTWWAAHLVYPGRPKGDINNLGAPMYFMDYNPQAGGMGGTCHNNRHYGLSVLTQTDTDPYLEMVDVAGVEVNDFTDVVQNISRNVALIDAKLNDQGYLVRSLAWNRPMHTTKPDCTPTLMYKNSLHYPSHTLIQDTGSSTKYVQFSRWTQLTQPENCAQSDFDCYKRVMTGMTGYWSWELLNAQTGATVKSYRNSYLWGVIPGLDPTKLWVLYSRNANTWNLGYTDIEGTTPLLRDDLTLALLDTTNPELPLTNVQNLPPQMRPFLKLFYWQNAGNNYTINTWGVKLFTIPDTAGVPERFVVKHASGMTLYAFRNDTWSAQYQYDSSGRLLLPTPTPTGSLPSTPTPTSMPTATPTPTPSSAPSGSPNPTPTGSPSPTPTPAYSCPTNGLIHYWNLNSPSAFILDNVGSLTGSGYNITWTAGKRGNAKRFNGTSSYIDFGNVLPIDRTTVFSFAFWMNEPDRDEISHIIAKQDNLNVGQGYAIAIGKSDQLVFNIANDSHAGNMIQVQGGVIRDGNWHMVVVTYDGSSSGKGVKFYVDGKLPTTSVTLDSLSQSPVATVPLRFGTRGHAGAKFGTYAGILDEVGYWNRVLTAQDVTALYNNGLGLTCP